MIDEKLLRILCCPATKQALHPANDEAVARLNARADVDPFAEGLEREDGAVVYPVRKGVPILLVSAAIEIGDDNPTETSGLGEENPDRD